MGNWHRHNGTNTKTHNRTCKVR